MSLFFTKEVKAKVLSKNEEKLENAPWVSGGSLVEVAATMDKSKSMYFHNVVYRITFLVGTKKKAFEVEKGIYDRITEGREGILTYKGSDFISFTEE